MTFTFYRNLEKLYFDKVIRQIFLALRITYFGRMRITFQMDSPEDLFLPLF